jgi:hypothetical protein
MKTADKFSRESSFNKLESERRRLTPEGTTMTNILLLTLSFFMIFGTSSITAEQKTDSFKLSSLSKEGQTAYKKLHAAMQFEDAQIGFAGSLSEYVVEFGALLEEKNADAAFKSILRNGTPAGQLYGLSGIYFTDYEFFKVAVNKFNKNEKIVMRISGCILFDEKMSAIVESNAGNVAIIKPTQTLEDFWKSNKRGFQLDIAHGGYPATFKHFADKSKQDGKETRSNRGWWSNRSSGRMEDGDPSIDNKF